MPRSLPALAVFVFSVLAAAGCAVADDVPESDQKSSATVSDPQAREAVFSTLRARTQNLDAVYFADDLGDYLPIQEVRVEGKPPRPLSPAGIVTGAIEDAEVTAAYRIADESEREAGNDGVRVDTEAPDADWRVITASFAVDDAWSDQVVEGDSITIDLSFSGSAKVEEFLQGLESMKDTIVVLDGANQIGDATFSVAENGTLLGVAGPKQISFPALTPRDEEAFVGGLNTLDRLQSAAKEPREPIVVRDGVVASAGE